MDVLVSATLAVFEAVALEVMCGRKQGPHVQYLTAWKIWAFFLAQYIVFKCYRIFIYPKYCSPLRNLPGPKDNNPFFGQTINLLTAKTPTSLYLKWMQEFPNAPLIRYLSFANKEVLVLNSLQSHKDLLQTHCYSFRKPDNLRHLLKAVVGDSIFMLEGKQHEAHWKILNGFFSQKKLRQLEPHLQGMAIMFAQSLEGHIPAGDKGRNVIFNCTDIFSPGTLKIIELATLGIHINTFPHAEGSGPTETLTLHEAYNAIFAQGYMGRVLMWADEFFPTRWVPVKANRRFLSATTWLTEVLTRIVRERYCSVMKDPDSPDLLTSFVKETLAGGSVKSINEQELVDHLLQIMVAGHETSAMTLSWVVYILVTKQDIQTALRAEISELLMRKADPTFAEIEKLAYLNNVVMETLRVYSPAPITHRQAEADVVIDGVLVPRGTVIEMIPSVAMLNPTIWGKDAGEVDPTRWDRLTGNQHSPYAFEAFSNVSHICIARSFALREIKLILFEMIRAFRFLEVIEPFEIEKPGLALRPVGLRVRCQRL